MVWIQDPVAGANVDLAAQFVFGRGVPKAKANDPKVQEVIDDAWCHDEATEVLTVDGWLDLGEVRTRWAAGTMPQVATFTDGELRYETPDALNITQRSGEMLRYATQQIDLLVTPNHRLVVKGQGARRWVTQRADASTSAGWRIPASARLATGVRVEEFVLPGCFTRARRHADVAAGVTRTPDDRRAKRESRRLSMDSFLGWLGWFLAEGHVSYSGRRPSWSVYVCQSTESAVLPDVRRACAELGLPGREQVKPARDARTPTDKWEWHARSAKQLGLWLQEHAYDGGHKRVPEFVFALAAEQQALVLEGLLKGDGNWARIKALGHGAFYTTSPFLADDVQRLAVNCGWKASRAPRREQRAGWKDQHRVQLNQRRENWLPKPESIPYDGEVWCFSMPSGTMVTRRNGKTAMTGNSDPDNKLVLTSFQAQVALLTDLILQSNLYILIFDEGDDGKVKLGILDHDSVEDAVRDSENRLKVLYYVARRRTYGWDYERDRPDIKSQMDQMTPGKPRVYYYRALAATDPDTGEVLTKDDPPPSEKLAEGLVYHIAVNRSSEQVFGIPAMRRAVKWLSSLNDFAAARVDLTQAAAAFIMKRSVKGSPSQVAKIAAQAVSRRSDLASVSIDDPNAGTILPGPRPGSILTESDAVTTAPFNVSTQAAQAGQDAQMIRSQISAATGWPQHYLGDPSATSLGTAQALETAVLKKVEALQELFEGLFRTFIDRSIQQAVKAGTLPSELTPDERAKLKKKKPEERQTGEPEPTQDQTEPSANGNGRPNPTAGRLRGTVGG